MEVDAFMQLVLESDALHAKCNISELAVAAVSLSQGTGKLARQASELLTSLETKTASTGTLVGYLHAKESEGQDLTEEDAETLINELEVVEEFLIETQSEILNMKRSHNVKVKRFHTLTLNDKKA